MGDSTPPSVDSFTMSDTTITWGETVTVTLVFNEAVSNFSSDDDITVQNGTLSTMTTSNNITCTGTFYPTNDISDNTNVLTLANTYTDSAGNTGPTATTSGASGLVPSDCCNNQPSGALNAISSSLLSKIWLPVDSTGILSVRSGGDNSINTP